MELISEPAFVEKTVTDVDVAYPTGLRTLTLGQGDTLHNNAHDFTIEFAPTATVPTETLVLLRAPMLWYSIRERVVRYPVKPAPPPPTAQPLQE